ncbi:HD domain-containing protein [Acidaminobacter sp. JC074]|uniref:HD domain-containing protein n=1 Tax=Acidaminobacter sp. JC074 TaxID=2530199 RepID=UPI001F1043B6|nr:HD domain-containing protein [Acidaminobacter sp. JC074]MCH4890816.1 HD domain-containing protein [Acidaminobacter sp. JC074]
MKESLIVTRIRNYVLGLTEISGHPNKDFSHAIHVSENMQLLAKLRQLDEDDAQLIGWLHDIGRMKSLGDPHGHTGAVEAERLLNHYELDLDKIELISHAIFHHSEKDLIHGPYDEMIKDADAMAHEYDHEDMDEYESFRALVAVETKDQLVMNYNPDALRFLIETDYMSMSAVNLHDYSKKVRAIIWLIKKHDCMTDELKEINAYFKELEKLTKVSHEEAIMEKHRLLSDSEISDDIDQLIKYKSKSMSLEALEILYSLDLNVDVICKKFIKGLNRVDIVNEESLSKLKSGLKHIYQLLKLDVLQCNYSELVIGLYETLEEWLIISDSSLSNDHLKLALFKVKKMWL